MVYTASDYAGLNAGVYKFYYGYEETDAMGDWCFVAWVDGREVMRVPQHELSTEKYDETEMNLMLGIAQFLEREQG